MTPAPMTPASLRWRPIALAVVLFFSAIGSRSSAAEVSSLVSSAEVLRAVHEARLDAIRDGLPPLDLSVLLRPLADLEPEPPGEWIYRAPVIGSVARATGGVEGRFQLGLRQLAQGLLDEAAQVFAEVRESHPNATRADDAAFWLAEIRRRQSRIDEAIWFLRLVRGPRAEEASYRLGRLLHFQGRVLEAASLWQGLATRENGPYRIRSRVAWGASLLLRGDVAGAREVLEAVATASRPSSGLEGEAGYSALVPLALARQRAGELSSAQRAILELLLERPDHPAASFADLALGWMLLEDGRSAEALRRFSESLEAQPPGPLPVSARLGWVLAQIDLGRVGEAEQALSAPDGNPRGFWQGSPLLALFYLQHGDPQRALTWVSATPEAPTSTAALCAYLSGESLRLVGRTQEAGAAYEAVPADALVWPAARHGKVLLALARSDWKEAADLSGDLLKRRPDYSGADVVRVAQARALTRLGQFEPARVLAEAVFPGNDAFADALLLRGSLAAARSRWAEAAGLFSRFLAGFPGDPRAEEALLGRARAEFRRGASLSALEALDTLDRRSPTSDTGSESRLQRAQVLLSLDRDREAREILEAELIWVLGSPREGLAQQQMGVLEAKENHCVAATAHFKRFLELSSSEDAARETRLGLARCLFGLNRLDEALQEFQASGDSLDSLYGRALCLEKLGRLDDFEKTTKAFREKKGPGADPREAELAALLGQGRLAEGRRLLVAGNVEKGLSVLEEASRSPGKTAAEALELIARHREEKGEVAQALEAWDRLAGASPPGACRALRSAARLADRLRDVPGARDRLSKALAVCPASDVPARQAILTDLGELALRAGDREAGFRFLREADAAGLGSDALRALLALAGAQENAGLGPEALETRLRIGYVYGVDSPAKAESLFRAAKLFEVLGRPSRSRALYRRLAEEAHGPTAENAKKELARLIAEVPAPAEPPPLPSRPSP